MFNNDVIENKIKEVVQYLFCKNCDIKNIKK